MHRHSFLFRIFLSYLAVTFTVISVCVVFQFTLIRKMKEKTLEVNQIRVQHVAEEMTTLFDSFRKRSVVLGNKNQMLKGRVLASSVNVAEAISVLQDARSSDVLIHDVFISYGTDDVFCSDGKTNRSSFFSHHLSFPGEDALQAPAVISLSSDSVSFIQTGNEQYCVFLHYPVRVIGNSASVSINYILSDTSLRNLINEVLQLDGTSFTFLSPLGSAVTYLKEGGKILCQSVIPEAEKGSIILSVTDEDMGIVYRAHYKQSELFSDSNSLTVWLIVLSVTSSSIAFIVSYLIAWNYQRPIQKINEIAASVAITHNREMKSYDIKNIEEQFASLYSNHMNLIASNQLLMTLQRRQVALLVFHGVLSMQGDIEQQLRNVNMELSEQYFFLGYISLSDRYTQHMDSALEPYLYEKRQTDDQLSYVFLYELPHMDENRELRLAVMKMLVQSVPENDVTQTRISDVSGDVATIAQTYRSLISWSPNIVATDGKMHLWDEVFSLLGQYEQALAEGDPDCIMPRIDSIRRCANESTQMSADIQREVMLRTGFMLTNIADSTIIQRDLGRLIPDGKEEFWAEILRLLRDVFHEHEFAGDKMKQAEAFIRENFKRFDLSLEEVADKCGFEKHYFSKRFRMVFGKRYIDYLSDLRMEEARRLALSTDMKTTDIAEDVGYLDVANFRRKFTAYYGKGVSDLRRSETAAAYQPPTVSDHTK